MTLSQSNSIETLLSSQKYHTDRRFLEALETMSKSSRMYFNYEMRQTNWDVYIGLQLATKWNPYLHIPLVDEHFLDYDLCVVSLVVP